MRCLNILLLACFTNYAATASRLPSNEELLKKISENLQSLKSITYEHSRELNYPSSSFSNELSGTVYLDFTSSDKVLGARYYFKGGYLILAFNGSESFVCNDVDQSIRITRHPKDTDMESLSFLNHSILTLRNAFPWLIADTALPKQIQDTLLNNNPCIQVIFTLQRSIIGTLGKKWPLTDNINMTYQVIIDQKSLLPVEVILKNNANADFLRTRFSNIKINTELPDENMLYYSNYLSRYNEPAADAAISLIKPGKSSPDWQLENINSGKLVSLRELRGNVVLLDFWIYHCSYCILQIPELNALSDKFKGKTFRLLGINPYDEKELVRKFMDKRGPLIYDVLFNGDTVRQQYGVSVFPTVILLDKTGKVIYAGPFRRDVIEGLIKENL